MKKMTVVVFALTLFFVGNNLNAQEVIKNAVIIDGTQVDSILCWGFDKMDVLFPVDKNKWKKYDKVVVKVLYEDSGKDDHAVGFAFGFMPDQLDEYFSDDVKYGVWHFLTGEKGVYPENGASIHQVEYTKKVFWDYSTDGARIWVEVFGATLNGKSYYDQYGQKVMGYSYISLYKSKYAPIRGRKKNFKYAFTKSKNATTTCEMPGQKFDMKYTAAGGNLDKLEVIK